ncbi:putative integron gene cassette protein [Globomyces pollinis-pini]|nr:putative integron gene cassette protein [Globomyces pollinis-pini]
MRLNQVTLGVQFMKESVQFYKKLGFQQIVGTDTYARFMDSTGESSFSLEYNPESKPNETVIYFETKDLDDKVKFLQTQGITFDQEPKDERWLWREARLKDPNGNILCLYWAGENRLNPPWRLK